MSAPDAAVGAVVRGMVRLYPRSFRERWGSSIEEDSQVTGWRSVPSLLTGALDMWLHPAVWPASTPAQRQRRALVLTVAVACAAWLVMHALTELDDPIGRGMRDPGTLRFWSALLALGLVLVLPRPRLDRAVLAVAARTFLVGLAPALVMATVVVFAANGGVADVAHSELRPVLLTLWWVSLGLAAIGACRAFAAVTAVLAPAGPGRARAGLTCLIGSTVLSTVTVIRAAAGHATSVGAILSVGALLAGGAVLVFTLRDLNTLVGRCD